jgi:hypothetical protein
VLFHRRGAVVQAMVAGMVSSPDLMQLLTVSTALPLMVLMGGPLSQFSLVMTFCARMIDSPALLQLLAVRGGITFAIWGVW